MNELELRIDEMLTLVDEFGVDAWDTIALKLGHSAKECVFAYRNYYEEFLGARMKRWTEEDQRTLVNAYNAYGFSGWKNIAACFPDRRPSDVVDELYELERVLHRNDTTVPYENTNDSPQRYASSPRTNELPQLRSKLQTSRVKTPWTEAECDALQKIIKQIGAADWHRVSNYLETKTAPECKQQWKKLTRTCTYKGKTTWSPEEDRILIDKFNQYGKQWSKVLFSPFLYLYHVLDFQIPSSTHRQTMPRTLHHCPRSNPQQGKPSRPHFFDLNTKIPIIGSMDPPRVGTT